jgi:hypothetical protein
MTRADQAVESAADQLETIIEDARRRGEVKAEAAGLLASDPGLAHRPEHDGTSRDGSATAVPRPVTHSRPKHNGLNPWFVVGIGFALGVLAAKVIDWRSHAHPRL